MWPLADCTVAIPLGTFFLAQTIRGCVAFTPFPTRKARFLLLDNFPSFIWCHCLESRTFIDVVICLTYVALILGFVYIVRTGGVSTNTHHVEEERVWLPVLRIAAPERSRAVISLSIPFRRFDIDGSNF